MIYLDFAGSRGEEFRIALHLAGVDFEDVRVQTKDSPAMKGSTPTGGLPVLEIPGKAPLAHSNAILVFIGRQHQLHPVDDFDAARQEALMCAVEDLRHRISPTLRISDLEQKRMAGEALGAHEIMPWGSQVESEFRDGPFVGGAALQVANLKLYIIVKWPSSCALDHLPASVLDHCPKLHRLHKAVSEHPGVKGWLARQKR